MNQSKSERQPSIVARRLTLGHLLSGAIFARFLPLPLVILHEEPSTIVSHRAQEFLQRGLSGARSFDVESGPCQQSFFGTYPRQFILLFVATRSIQRLDLLDLFAEPHIAGVLVHRPTPSPEDVEVCRGNNRAFD